MIFTAITECIDTFNSLFIDHSTYLNQEECRKLVQKIKDRHSTSNASWNAYKKNATRLSSFFVIQNSEEIGNLYFNQGAGPESIIKMTENWPYSPTSVESLRNTMRKFFRARTEDEKLKAKKFSGSFKGKMRCRFDLFPAIDEIIRMYKHEHMSSERIADEFNCSADFIRDTLRTNDIFSDIITRTNVLKSGHALRADNFINRPAEEKEKTRKKRHETIFKKPKEVRQAERNKAIETMRKRFGDDTIISCSQVREIHEKQQKFRWKDYTFACGTIAKIQGYEWIALKELESKGYKVSDISVREKVAYTCLLSGKKRRCFPDICIDGKIIEVKSTYTIVREKDKNRSILTQMLKDGRDFQFWVYKNENPELKIIIKTMEEFDDFVK